MVCYVLVYLNITEANISSSEVACLALSSQRATFTLWDRRTDHQLLNLITWKDQRGSEESSKWNNHFVLKVRTIEIGYHYACTLDRQAKQKVDL